MGTVGLGKGEGKGDYSGACALAVLSPSHTCELGPLAWQGKLREPGYDLHSRGKNDIWMKVSVPGKRRACTRCG